MDDALPALSEQYHAIVQSSPVAIVALDRAGAVTLWNPAAEHLFGWTRDEVLGKPLPFIPEAKREEHRRFRDRDLRGDNLKNVEIKRVRKDGSSVDLNVSTAALRNGDGAVVGIMSLYVDVTARKNAEAALRQANEDLIKANRELEEFAYVASHDLREPLRMINIYTEMLLKRHVSLQNAEAQECGRFIEQGVHRMDVLIDDLLSYSRTISTEFVTAFHSADLGVCLGQVLETFQNAICESGARVTYDRLPRVRGDEAQLSLVFQNLLSNSLKYRNPAKTLHVHIASAAVDDECVISISDNGIGFEPQYAHRIFGLFKRLHTSEYPGTGLGLAICKRILERHGGRIWAEGHPGEGAVFHFALPAAPGN